MEPNSATKEAPAIALSALPVEGSNLPPSAYDSTWEISVHSCPVAGRL
jgi:hypothetical protein